jgi:hypothetical protein
MVNFVEHTDRAVRKRERTRARSALCRIRLLRTAKPAQPGNHVASEVVAASQRECESLVSAVHHSGNSLGNARPPRDSAAGRKG